MKSPLFVFHLEHQSYLFNALNITFAFRNDSGTNVEGIDMKPRWIPVPFEEFMKAWRGAMPDDLPVMAKVKIDGHYDDLALDRFSAELRQKMTENRKKGRSGWEKCSPQELSDSLRGHIEKGDPRDVAIYAMFLWCLGEQILPEKP